jgi:2-isopropylmalate synthase
MVMKTRRDYYPYETGIVTEQLYPASQLLSGIITFGPQPNKAIVGANAFAHEAGIHQDGYLKNKSTYEIIDPRSVGVPEGKLILGKHSGRHALKERVKELGYAELTPEQVDRVYERFTSAADNKKGFTNEEITEFIEAAIEKAAEKVS